MDFTKLPRQLIYRDRKSLEEFTKNNQKNKELINRMLGISFLQTPDFKERVLDCFNAAYYICTLMLAEENPEWSTPFFIDCARCNQKDNCEGQAVTLSLVRIYIQEFDEEWLKHHQVIANNIDEFMQKKWVDPPLEYYAGYSYNDVLNELDVFPVQLYSLPSNEFALRKIDQETIDDVHFSPFSWSKLTEGYKKSIMEDIVFQVGKDMSEMKLLLKSFNHDAEKTYGKDDLRYESVCNRTGEIDGDVFLYYHADDICNADEYDDVGDATSSAILNPKIEQLEKRIDENTITQEQFDNIFGNDEKPAVLNANNSQQTDASAEVKRLQAEVEQWKAESERLKEELDEAKKTINEQQAELKRLNTLNEVLTNQNARYDEKNPEMDIDEDTALGIKESIIFFSSIMDCNLSKEDISQMNFARLISKITKWPRESIRTQIVDINTERENNTNNHTAFSDGVHQAAVNVCALIENAMAGLKKNSLPYSCKQAVENILKIYNSPGRKIEPHEIAEAKKILKKI